MVLLFCKEKNFNKEKTKFLLRHQGHESLVELIEKIREDWQNDFADLRNRHEHDGDFRNNDVMCNPQAAKVNLIYICASAEIIIAYCGSHSMRREWGVVEVNPKATIFDEESKYIVEHGLATRAKRAKKLIVV